MPFDEQKQIQQLIGVYRQGFEEILRVLVEGKPPRGFDQQMWQRYWQDMLLQVREILLQLDQYSDRWIKQTIGQIYSRAAADTAAFLSQLRLQKPEKPEFAQVHQRAIDVMAQNMADNLRDAMQFIGRRIDDVFRRVGLEETGRKFAAGQTWQDMKQKVIQQLLDRGQTAFVDRLGRKWRLDAYAEMVARTTTREAASVATLNTCQEFGLDLVRITTHYPTCERCASLQGKVFSMSGEDKRYPKLTDEYRPPIHPHCRHVLTPYVRELDDDAERTERFSNQLLDEDLRSEAEKRAYKMLLQKRAIGMQRLRIAEILNSPFTDYDAKMKAAARLERLLKGGDVEKVGVDRSVFERYLLPRKIDNATSISEVEGILERAFGWTVEFTGVDEELAKIAAKHLARLQYHYPQAAEKLQYIGTYLGEKTPEGLKGYQWGNQMAHAYRHLRIGLNPEWWGNKQLFLDTLKHAVENKWFPRGADTPEAILTHEYGHILDSWLNICNSAFLPYVRTSDGFGLVNSTWLELKERYRPTEKLSRYALEKKSEAVPEAFSAIHHSPILEDDFAQKVKAFLDVVFNEKWYNEGEYKWRDELAPEEGERAKKLLERYEKLLRWK